MLQEFYKVWWIYTRDSRQTVRHNNISMTRILQVQLYKDKGAFATPEHSPLALASEITINITLNRIYRAIAFPDFSLFFI